jgi:ribonuclease III
MSTHEVRVATCESIIQYVFKDKRLCLQALQASGHPLRWGTGLIRVDRNDRLAVFGDTVAKTFLCKQWLETRRTKGGLLCSIPLCSHVGLTSNQGEWTQVEQALLVNTNLSAIGYNRNLHTCVILNMGTASVSPKTMATTVEAVLGAVYLDGGDDALSAVMVSLGLTHPLLQQVTSNPCVHVMFEEITASLR